MREDWKYERLLDACDVYQPATISTKQLVENGEFDVFGANGKIGKYSSYNHEEPEVLLTCRGATCGNINVSTPKSWINGNAMVVHPKEKNLLKNYLVYLLKTLNYTEVITGSAQPQITRLSLKNVYIPVPPLSEQERIVSLLDAEFAKIDALKANAATQLQAARDLFQSALKQLLTPKEGWERKLLKDISTYYNGLTYKPIDVSDNGFLVLRSSNIQDNILTLEDQVRVSVDINDKLKVHKGDIIMCSRNGSKALIGKVAIIPEEYDDMTFGTFMMVFKGEYNPFLYYFFLSDLFKKQIWRGEATMINQITRYMLDEVYVYIPSLPEQERIAARLDAISEKVKALQANYDQTINLCNDLKQSLLKSIFE